VHLDAGAGDFAVVLRRVAVTHEEQCARNVHREVERVAGVPPRGRLQVNVIKRQAIKWPRAENDTSIMTFGAYRPLDEAFRSAFAELMGWIHKDYGLSELDAYELLSKVAVIHLSEMVDPNYVVVARIDKKFLPPRRR